MQQTLRQASLLRWKTVCGENGTLTAQTGYGDALQTIDASSESGIKVEKGKKVVLTVTPADKYMREVDGQRHGSG